MSAVRRPVLYRTAVWTWVVVTVAAASLTVFVVPTGPQRVIAFGLLALAVAAALTLWRFGEYRAHVLGPPTSTSSRAWTLAAVAVCFVIARIVGNDAPYLAGVAGFGLGMALALPVLTYVTAIPESRSDTGTAEDPPTTTQ